MKNAFSRSAMTIGMILTLLLGISPVTFAQDNVSSAETGSISGSYQQGLYVGFEYMNITDLKAKAKFTNHDTGTTEESTATAGIHLGMAGVSIGYNKTPEVGVGTFIGARLMESFNRSEWGDDKAQIIMPEANLNYAFNKSFLIYGGGNIAIFSGPSSVHFTPGVGVQLGAGVRFSKNIGLNAGYTIMTEKTKMSFGSVENEIEYQLAGFNSSLVYTF